MVENMFVPLNVPLMFKLTRKTNLPACQREPKGCVTSLFHPDYRRGESYLPFVPFNVLNRVKMATHCHHVFPHLELLENKKVGNEISALSVTA